MTETTKTLVKSDRTLDELKAINPNILTYYNLEETIESLENGREITVALTSDPTKGTAKDDVMICAVDSGCNMHGLDGNDLMFGNGYMCGGPGDDILTGRNINSILCPGAGNNTAVMASEYRFKAGSITFIPDFGPIKILSFTPIKQISSICDLRFHHKQNMLSITIPEVPGVEVNLLGNDISLGASDFLFYANATLA